MNHVISWIQNVVVRQILVVCLIASAFFISPSFIYGNAAIAQAETVRTPEGTYYKGTPDQEGIKNSENPLKKAADTVREKLNLDEETPRATKEFTKSVKKQVEKTVEPITRNHDGYYREPERAREYKNRVN